MNSKNQERGHLSVADAQAEVLRHADRRTVETVTLERALGRVLVEDIRSNRDQPPYDVSAMDGFAVRAAAIEPLGIAFRQRRRIQQHDRHQVCGRMLGEDRPAEAALDQQRHAADVVDVQATEVTEASQRGRDTPVEADFTRR